MQRLSFLIYLRTKISVTFCSKTHKKPAKLEFEVEILKKTKEKLIHNHYTLL